MFITLRLPSTREVTRWENAINPTYNIEPHFETKVVEKKCEGLNQYEVLNAPLPIVVLTNASSISCRSEKRSLQRKLIQRKERSL